MYAMMQCKAKSESLAHILGYQIWVVTNLPPLQESRPEIPRVGRGRGETWSTLNFNDLLDPTTIFLVAEIKVIKHDVPTRTSEDSSM